MRTATLASLLVLASTTTAFSMHPRLQRAYDEIGRNHPDIVAIANKLHMTFEGVDEPPEYERNGERKWGMAISISTITNGKITSWNSKVYIGKRNYHPDDGDDFYLTANDDRGIEYALMHEIFEAEEATRTQHETGSFNPNITCATSSMRILTTPMIMTMSEFEGRLISYLMRGGDKFPVFIPLNKDWEVETEKVEWGPLTKPYIPVRTYIEYTRPSGEPMERHL